MGLNYKCCICGKACEGWGNNPEPYKSEGQCCDQCNYGIVIPMRIRHARVNQMRKEKEQKGGKYE
jgi:DNA-directed RNA polymerase subunit RPC12/RpoP